MKQMRVSGALIAAFVCALLGWTFAHRNTGSNAYAQQTTDATIIPGPSNDSPHYSYGGLSLAPASMGTNSDSAMLTSLLNATILKFSANTTQPNLMVTYILEVREKGQPTKTISSFAFGPFGGNTEPGPSNLYVGFLPLSGSGERDLVDSAKIKWEIRTGDIDQAAVIDNPFMACTYYGSPTRDSSQHDIPLLTAYTRKGAESSEKTLYLRLRTKVGR